MKNSTIVFMTAVAVTLASVGVVAQDQKPPQAKAPDAPQVAPKTLPSIPLRLQIVIATYQGERKISSVPYTLSANATPRPDTRRPAQLRMGTRVPVPSTKPPTIDGKPVTDIPGFLGPGSFTYQDVGTNIDCLAAITDDGRFELTISIEDTSILNGKANEPPLFRSFRLSNQVVVLRDGQSTQFTGATDRVSGEVVRVDVTLNVVK